ncbi:hypothetical protein KY289_013546, partial [Solanum tuberosum]
GCGKMTSRIGGAANGGNWKHEHGTAHYGRNFSVKWLKLCELSFQKTHHLRNPYNENLPVKISRDCQELEPSVGEQLASLLYLEPDSELMIALDINIDNMHKTAADIYNGTLVSAFVSISVKALFLQEHGTHHPHMGCPRFHWSSYRISISDTLVSSFLRQIFHSSIATGGGELSILIFIGLIMTQFFPITCLKFSPTCLSPQTQNFAAILPFPCNVLYVIKHLMLELSTTRKGHGSYSNSTNYILLQLGSSRLYSNGIITAFQAISLAAESKRQEEKAKGVNPDNGKDNPDIVPFEDNEEEEEEEEEEESEDEDESFDQGFGPAALGRGRGRGIAWPPIMPFGHGPRPPPGMRGFPPGMMGDGFSYGAMTPEGFPMPDHFGMGPRPFGPYGPPFSSDLMFHGRPPAGGFGMMMGPGRPPFMGGMGPGATGPPRAGRAVGMHPSFVPPSSQPSQYPYKAKREQRAPVSDRNDRFSSDQGKGQEMMGSVGGPDGVHMQIGKSEHDNQFGAGNSQKNEESESEDEAPRRSRHGDGKKKRRDVDEDAATGSENRCQ